MSFAKGESSIDLNADVGEGGVFDALLLASGITSANIACGAHAGDEATMAETCALAARYGVALGAHPGFADRENFGRREQAITPPELADLVAWQVRALQRHAERAGLPIRHVKPHGALYHLLNREPAHAECFALAVKSLIPAAQVFGPPTGSLRQACEAAGVVFAGEGFIDRGYRADGSLIARGEPGAELRDAEAAIAQALELAGSGRVRTLCVHGDGAEPVRLLTRVATALRAAGFRILRPPCDG